MRMCGIMSPMQQVQKDFINEFNELDGISLTFKIFLEAQKGLRRDSPLPEFAVATLRCARNLEDKELSIKVEEALRNAWSKIIPICLFELLYRRVYYIENNVLPYS